MATSDNRWDEAVAGRVEVDRESGEVGHYTSTLDPQLNAVVVDVVWRGWGFDSHETLGYSHAAGYQE